MRSPKDYVILLLALTTIGCAVLAWRQYRDLATLRATMLGGDERAEWQKRVWDAEKRRADTEKRLTETKPKADVAASEATPDDPFPLPATGRMDPRRRFGGVMDDPEVQRLMALQHKAGLDGRYAALFRSLNLTPEQLDKFKNLLVDKNTAMMDVIAAARDQGISRRSDRDAFNKLVADAQAEIDESIRSAIGEVGYSQYKDYEQTMPQRAIANQLEQRLSYTNTPLTTEQSAQLVRILANTNPNAGPGMLGAPMTTVASPGGAVSFAFRGPGGNPTITDEAINQSLGVLAAPQVDALKQIQQEQQAQAELGAAMRRQFQDNRAGVPAAPPGPPPGG